MTFKTSSEFIGKQLEAMGWKREIAGDDDFSRACEALRIMFETGRGLLITGAAGCGKTHLMRVVKKGLTPDTTRWFYCKDCNDIARMRTISAAREIDGNAYVDDIGCEEIIREFGNVVDVVGDFIQKFHYRGTGRLLCTTNCNSAQLNEKYGTRVLDRILEMCVVLKLNGKSKRERIIV